MSESLGGFLAMGGYGLYVWGSLGMCAVTMGLEVFLLRSRRRALDQQALQSSGPSAADQQPTGSNA